MRWILPSRVIELGRPFVLGVVNVTPDSFSDGGWLADADAAVAHAERLLDTGADGVDIGGESTRPHNAGPVPVDEELRRVLPVVSTLRLTRPDALISIDTTKAEVARAALDAGADVVNDVSALRLDPEMAHVCASHGAGVILMHSRGTVADMATFAHADYGDDPVGDVVRELASQLDAARDAGIPGGRIVLDPGVGFSKRSAVSLAVLRELPRFAALGRPLMVGASRKRFIGELSGVSEPAARVHGSVGAHVAALAHGARLFRVHDVRAHREALDVAWAVLRGQEGTRAGGHEG
ncbi:dihydropteroate synthase [Gemmatirosa kalamazoonensis]|uniref:Dihydropteroate synthase n=1 Tax=Gemmatirosa kalamazoonensis TaxID=861299 RepID=W0RJR1_9BACT|nr:dihydropteroate synthase [Gemmatirosa kalamazoonensis]AHG90580.1 dihydropteroate synthase [Gemmatirosa kalamazoonensis]